MEFVAHFDNLESCCRTCLKKVSTETYDIFADADPEDNSVNVLEMLTLCTSIQVMKTDCLPKKLCEDCYYRLISCYEFRQLAEKADIRLQELAEGSKTTSVSEGKDLLPYIKSECDLTQRVQDILTNEKVKEENSRTESCDECPDDFPLQDFNDEQLKPKIKCEVCYKKFKKLTCLEKHLEKHKVTGVKIYTCNICSRNFKRHFRYVRHLSTHGKSASEVNHNENEYTEDLNCHTCSVKFRSVNSLAAHMKKHAKKGRVLSCSICGKVFKKLSHVKRHELSHDENRPFKCTSCPKRFNTEGLLNEHMTKHVIVKPHICPMCSKGFVHPSALSTHLKVHTREKQYLCPTCGKKFDSSTNLNQHTRRHLGLKSFSCSSCPKKFVSKGELQTHSRTHTGEKPWRCSQCGAGFTKRGSLGHHMLRHAGVKPHQCDACPMRFVTRDHLKRHYRTHTGERPYRCVHCERAFTQGNDLAKHLRHHHQGQGEGEGQGEGGHPYKCDECPAGFRLKTELRRHCSQHYVSKQLLLQSDHPKDNSTAAPHIDGAEQDNCHQAGVHAESANVG